MHSRSLNYCKPKIYISRKFVDFITSTSILLQIYKYHSLLSSLPEIACLAFLSFQYPLLLFKGFKGTEKSNPFEVSVCSATDV